MHTCLHPSTTHTHTHAHEHTHAHAHAHAHKSSPQQWDLALAPSVCDAGEQFGGALGCSYNRITLISAAVRDDKLYVLQVAIVS